MLTWLDCVKCECEHLDRSRNFGKLGYIQVYRVIKLRSWLDGWISKIVFSQNGMDAVSLGSNNHCKL